MPNLASSMRSTVPVTFATAILLLGSAAANAVVIDFEILRHDDASIAHIDSPYSEDEYSISSVALATIGTLLDASNTAQASFSGSTALSAQSDYAEIVLSRVDGGLFDLISIDLSEAEDNQFPGATVTFTGYQYESPVITQQFTLDGVAFAAETFFFDTDFSGLSSVHWLQGGGSSNNPQDIAAKSIHQFDNIVLVPEPSAALLLGFGLIGIAARRRRSVSR